MHQRPGVRGTQNTQPLAAPPGGTTTSVAPTGTNGTPMPKSDTPNSSVTAAGSPGSRLITSAQSSVGCPATGGSGCTLISLWAYQGASCGGNVTDTACPKSRSPIGGMATSEETENTTVRSTLAASDTRVDETTPNRTKQAPTAMTGTTTANRTLFAFMAPPFLRQNRSDEQRHPALWTKCLRARQTAKGSSGISSAPPP